MHRFQTKTRNTIKSIFKSFSPTKRLGILVLAPLWHLFCTNVLKWCRKCTLGAIRDKFAFWCKLSILMLKNYAGTAPFKGNIWDEFSDQNQHESVKKATYLMHNYSKKDQVKYFSKNSSPLLLTNHCQ